MQLSIRYCSVQEMLCSVQCLSEVTLIKSEVAGKAHIGGNGWHSLSGGTAHLAALIADSLADAALASWSVAQSLELSAVAGCRASSISSMHLLADKALLVCWYYDHCRNVNATMLTCVAAGLMQSCMKASCPNTSMSEAMAAVELHCAAICSSFKSLTEKLQDYLTQKQSRHATDTAKHRAKGCKSGCQVALQFAMHGLVFA